MFAVARENPEFARLWSAQVVSQLGDWLGRIAILSIIQQLGGADATVGLGALYAVEFALRLLPGALLSPLAGSVADRLPRRRVMLGADVIRAAIILAILLVRDPGQLPLLYGLLVAQMGTSVFFETARSATVPSTVGRESLQDAHTLSAATWSTLLTAGALLGGVMVKLIGVEGTLLVDAASYLVSAGILLRLRLPPVARQAAPFHWRDVLLFRDLRHGWLHARELGITPAVLTKFFWGAAAGYIVLLPIAAVRRFAPGAEGSPSCDPGAVASTGAFFTGILYAARGIGTGLGPVISRRLLGREDGALRLQISLGFLLGSAGYVLFTFAPGLAPALGCVVLAHIGGSTIWVASTVLWQKHVHNEYQGRVFSIEFLFMDVAFASGALVGGLSYDATGSLDHALWILSGIVLVSGAVWTFLARDIGSEAVEDQPAASGPAAPDSPAEVTRDRG